jgi:hypothetical protein
MTVSHLETSTKSLEGDEGICFQKLPDDIHSQILDKLDSPKDLYALLQASPASHRAFKPHKIGILSSVIQNTMGFSALQDALACVLCPSNTEDPWTAEVTALDEEHVVSRLEKRRELTQLLTRWRAKELKLEADLQTLNRLYHLEATIRSCTAQFTQHVRKSFQDWRVNLSSYGGTAPTFAVKDELSETETGRLRRAFLKYELWCRVYGPAKGNCSLFHGPGAQLIWPLEDWEMEEVASVFEYLSHNQYHKLWKEFKGRSIDLIKSKVIMVDRTMPGYTTCSPGSQFDSEDDEIPESPFESEYADRRFLIGTVEGTPPFGEEMQFVECLTQYGLGIHRNLHTSSKDYLDEFFRTTYRTLLDLFPKICRIGVTLGSSRSRRLAQAIGEPLDPFTVDRIGSPNAFWIRLDEGWRRNGNTTGGGQWAVIGNRQFCTLGTVFWDKCRLERIGLLKNNEVDFKLAQALQLADNQLRWQQFAMGPRDAIDVLPEKGITKENWKTFVARYRIKSTDSDIAMEMTRSTDGKNVQLFGLSNRNNDNQ